MALFQIWIGAMFTCLNCSSNVQDPPSSLLPVDCGVGGCEGRLACWCWDKEDKGLWPRPARKFPWAPAWRRRASRAGRPWRLAKDSGRPSLGTGWMGRRSERMPMVGLPCSSVSMSDWSSDVSLLVMSLWESCLRSVPLSPGLSGSCSDTPLLGDCK